MAAAAHRFTLFVVFLSFPFHGRGALKSSRMHTTDLLDEIGTRVRHIHEMMRQEERLNELKNIIQMEKTLEDVRKRVEEVARRMDARSGGGEGGVVVQDALEKLNTRVHALEKNNEAFQTDMQQRMAEGAAKIAEVHGTAKNWEKDFDAKLRKMMNAISSVYQINKNLETAIDNGRVGTPESRSSTQPNGDGLAFVSDQIQGVQKRVEEEISVLTVHVKRKFAELEGTVRTVLAQLETLESDVRSGLESQCVSGGKTTRPDETTNSDDPYDDDYEYQLFADPSRQRSIARPLGRALRNLTAAQTQMREDLRDGFQRIEDKLASTTGSAAAECGRMTKAVESPDVGGTGPRTAPLDSRTAMDPVSAPSCSNATSARNPKSCAEIRKGGATCDGVYIIFPMHKTARRVWCNMRRDGGGWTVVLRRGDFGEPRQPFDMSWKDYKTGFGFPEGEHWIGNEALHLLTAQNPVELRVNLETFDGEWANLTYGHFDVGTESEHFRLSVGGVPGNAAFPVTEFLVLDGRPFGTHDFPNQDENCPRKMKGGWWFRRAHCTGPFLTGPYFKKGEARRRRDGIQWPGWKGDNVLRYAEMIVRPRDFRASLS